MTPTSTGAYPLRRRCRGDRRGIGGKAKGEVAEAARLELASLLGRQISNLLEYQLSYASVNRRLRLKLRARSRQ